MQMTPVTSSAFRAVHHDGARTLTIEFHGGDRRRYGGVAKAHFDRFMAARPLGRHFATMIKPYHRATKVS